MRWLWVARFWISRFSDDSLNLCDPFIPNIASTKAASLGGHHMTFSSPQREIRRVMNRRVGIVHFSSVSESLWFSETEWQDHPNDMMNSDGFSDGIQGSLPFGFCSQIVMLSFPVRLLGLFPPRSCPVGIEAWVISRSSHSGDAPTRSGMSFPALLDHD
jgi:hypothetical protein